MILLNSTSMDKMSGNISFSFVSWRKKISCQSVLNFDFEKHMLFGGLLKPSYKKKGKRYLQVFKCIVCSKPRTFR